MGTKISSGFDLNSGVPIDSRTTKNTIALRNAISSTIRYEGLPVYVKETRKNYQLQGGITNTNWVDLSSGGGGGSTLVPISDVLYWDGTANKYRPYSAATDGAFYIGTVAPTTTTRLNYDGYLYATQLYDNGTRVSTIDHSHTGTYELILSHPSVTGQVLASTTAGVKSWVTLPTPDASWWSSMPLATTTTVGGIQYDVGTTKFLREDGTWQIPAGGSGGSMTYPSGTGISIVSSGISWGTTITDNSANWNTAYSWGNHALVGYSTVSHADVVVDGDFTSQGIMLRGASAGVYSILTNNSTNWNTAYSWGNHSGLYRPIAYVPTWSEITSNPFSIVTPSNGQLLKYNSTSSKWENWTHNFLSTYTETDPVWTAASTNYYTKTNMQASGGASLHFNNLTNKPSTISGYGITDAMTTSHVANAITGTNISNWNTAFGWGNHAIVGYAPLSNPTFTGTASGTFSGTFISTGYTIVAESGKLVIKYNNVTIVSIASSGAIISANEITDHSTP